MIKLKKIIKYAAFVMVLGLTFAGCGKKNQDPSTESVSTEEKKSIINDYDSDTLVIDSDFTIEEVACDDFSDVSVDYTGLKDFIINEVEDFNSKSSDKDAVGFVDFQAENTSVKVLLTYKNIEYYNAFNGTSYYISSYDRVYCDNLYSEATLDSDISEIDEESKKELLDAGYSVDEETTETKKAEFTSISGSVVTTDDIIDTELSMFVCDMDLTIKLNGKRIVYYNDNVTLDAGNVARCSGEGVAVILFK